MSIIKLQQIAPIGSELALAWEDGEETYLSFENLRKACPCAACQGEPDVTGKVLLPKVIHTEKSFELLRYEIVGGYALQLFWADGHNTGIYSFAYLRGLS
ncbi:DUF971 domain-containing protein [Akkermansiaceae bacterium]|nr:DUF971 domain-containing protein [Akkermansiaceae bacterium]MDB4538082.1 DUF971 domain-containing protein [Akkermansiaceae bacterium]